MQLKRRMGNNRKYNLPLPPRMKVDLACSKDSNIFQAKVLKADSQNHPGFVWHGFGMLGLNVLISVRSGLKSERDWGKQKGSRTNSKCTSDYGRRRDTCRILQAKCSARGSSLLALKGVGILTHFNLHRCAEWWQFAWSQRQN